MLLSGPALAQADNALAAQISTTQDPDQLYQMALDALAANQPELARQAFERVVTSKPHFAGAWLDLAMASYRSGNPAAALEHLVYLQSRFDIPAPLAAQVAYWVKLLQGPPTAIPQAAWQGELWLGIGQDSNANLGLLRDQIALSLAAGSTLFGVADAYRPRADTFTALGLTLQGPAWAVAGDAQVRPVVFARSREFAAERPFSSLDLQPGLVYQRSLPGKGTWQAGLFAQHYRVGGQAQFNALRLNVHRSQPWRACQISGTSLLENRHDQLTPALGGKALSLKLGLACELPGQASAAAYLSSGIERANPNRAGGGNHTTELSLRYERPLDAWRSLHVNWQITQIGDQTSYSPWLESNAVRSVRRHAFGLSLRQNITQQWQARLGLEAFVQRSNLPLFEQQARQLMLSLNYQIL